MSERQAQLQAENRAVLDNLIAERDRYREALERIQRLDWEPGHAHLVALKATAIAQDALKERPS